MAETQRSVGEWREATFGRPASVGPVAARFLLEAVELAGPYLPQDLAVELALLARAAAERVRDEPGRAPDEGTIEEAADCLVLLYGVAHHLRRDLGEALDAKMAVNRARTWRVDRPGMGQHE